MGKYKVRTIYSNYDLWEDYYQTAKEECFEEGLEITEGHVWDKIYQLDSEEWEEISCMLTRFFKGSLWIVQGYVERWDGRHNGGFIFTDFLETLRVTVKDCDYIHLYEEGSRMFLTCSHHDGKNQYEIRKVTEKGRAYLKRWENSQNDTRSLAYVHSMVMKHYSVAPNYLAYEEK